MNRQRVTELAAGTLLTAGSATVLVAAGLPRFRVFTSSTRRQQLEHIAARKWGWTAQAYLFPIGFGTVAAGVAVASAMPEMRAHPARRLTRMAVQNGAAAALLWIPISRERLRTGENVDLLLAAADSELEPPASPTFWPYTTSAVGATGLLGAALAWTGVARRTGAAVAAGAAIALGAMPRIGDWPPFATYLLTLPLGISLLRRRRDSVES